MTANGRIVLSWGDGEHGFNIAKLAQTFELEDKSGYEGGVFEVLDKLRLNRAPLRVVREVIRLGLIGDGMNPAAALALVDRYIEQWPLAGSQRLAFAIVGAAVVGVPGDPVGKKPEADRTSSPDGSAGPPSTHSAPQ